MGLRTKTPAAAWKAAGAKCANQYPRLRGSKKVKLTLTLLEAGVFLINDIQLTVAADNLAIHAALLDGGFYFHGCNVGL